MDGTKKNFILAIVPDYNYYTDIAISADIYVVKLACQLDDRLKDKQQIAFFDEFIGQELGQKYNAKAVFEALNHSIDKNGDCSAYKGLSLADIDHAAIYCGIFLYNYREALSFLSLVDKFSPSKILIGADDANRGLFEEMAKQLGIETEIILSFGTVDKRKSELIGKSNRSIDIQNLTWHGSTKHSQLKTVITWLVNNWARLVRLIQPRRPFVYVDNGGQLSKIKETLSCQKQYYPLYRELNKLPIKKLFFNGLCVLPMNNNPRSETLTEIIRSYVEHLSSDRQTSFGQIAVSDKKCSIADVIARQLIEYAPSAFAEIAGAIDAYEKFANANNVRGALLSSDMNWENRMIVRLFQKHRLRNSALMNGWFGVRHMVENKLVDKVLCFGDSYKENYFHDKKNVKTIGCPTFDHANQKRAVAKPQYPIKKILVSTFTFSPADINCHYRDSEKYLNDILSVIGNYNQEQHGQLQIALRPHPSDNPDFYRWYLARLGYSDIPLELEGNFQNVVARHDMYFGSYSTTIFEAAAMGIPVIFYHPCNQIMYPPFDGSCRELPMAETASELKQVFQRVMQNKEFAFGFTDKNALAPYVSDLDGLATSRIMDEVVRMAKGN